MQYSLIIAQHHWEAWLNHFRGLREERMAFGFCGATRTDQEIQYLVRTVDLPRDAEYRFQGVGAVSLRAEEVVRRLVQVRDCAALVDIHSHPFAGRPSPSGIDDRGGEGQMRTVGDVAPVAALIRMIVGESASVWAEVAPPGQLRWSPVRRIVVLGPDGRQQIIPINVVECPHAPPVSACDLRTKAVLGEEAARAVRDLKVVVIGAGGVGSAVIAQLRGYVDDLTIIDPDVVAGHNGPRLYHYADGDEGQFKADIHVREVRRAFPHSQVRAICGRFPEDGTLDAFKLADIVFCCPDHNAVRYAAATWGARFLKPIIEVGCGGKAQGGRLSALGYHVRLQVPGATCLACNGLDVVGLEDPRSTEAKHRAGYVTGADVVLGELMPLTTRAAADAVDIFFRYVTGYAGPTPRHLYFDAMSLKTIDATAAFGPKEGCTLCGAQGALGATLSGVGDVPGIDAQVLPSTGGCVRAAE